MRKHAGDRLAHRGAKGDVDAVERHAEAVGISRLLEQRARRRDVIRHPALELRHVAVDQAREKRAGGAGLSTQHLADNGVDVDRLVDGAPHAQVLERVLALDVAELQLVAALVETEILRSDIGGVGELESSFLLQTRDVLEGGIDDEVDLARDQRRHPRRVGLDDDVDRLVDIAALAPPIRVGDQHGAGVGFVALEPVGPGAVGVANRVGLLPRIVILRLDDPVRRGPRLAHDADVHEFFRQHGIGRGEQEVDGQIVDLARRLDTTQLEGPLRVLGQRPLDRKHDVVGGEGGSVVKLDSRAELEAPPFRLQVLP